MFDNSRDNYKCWTGTGILCLIIAETIISAGTGTGILCLIIAEAIISAGTGTGILCLIIAETITSPVTGLLVTCLCNNRLVSGGPVLFADSFWMS